MEHDLGLVYHHRYLGLGKRERGTSTKWSALDSPPSLGSHDWHNLAIYPYWIFVLWNRCYEEKCCFPADLNVQLLLQSVWVYSWIYVHTLHVLSRQTLLSLVSCALSQFSPNTASKGWLELPITIINNCLAKWMFIYSTVVFFTLYRIATTPSLGNLKPLVCYQAFWFGGIVTEAKSEWPQLEHRASSYTSHEISDSNPVMVPVNILTVTIQRAADLYSACIQQSWQL